MQKFFDSKSPLAWYGPVILAGVLFFLGTNGLGIWDRVRTSEVQVSGSAKLRRSVTPDAAKVVITVKNVLKDSARASAAGIGEKVDAFAAYLKTVASVSFNILPLSVNQEVIEVGDQFAKSYEARQKIEITLKDLQSVSAVIDQAVKSELGDISEVSYFLTNAAEARKKIRTQAFERAKGEAAEKAAGLGMSLDAVVDFAENEEDYGYRDDPLTPEEEFDHGAEGASESVMMTYKPVSLFHSVTVRYTLK